MDKELKRSIEAACLEFKEEPMDAYYSSFIAGYIPRLRVRKIVEELGGVKNKKILDIGCEAGYVALKLINKKADVTGIDVCEPALKKYVKRTREVPVLGIVHYMPFKDNVFEGIVASEVIEHMPDLDTVFKEIKRVLKHRGKIIMTFPNEGLRRKIYPIVKMFGINVDVEKKVTLFDYKFTDIINKCRKYFRVKKGYSIPFWFPLTRVIVCENER